MDNNQGQINIEVFTSVWEYVRNNAVMSHTGRGQIGSFWYDSRSDAFIGRTKVSALLNDGGRTKVLIFNRPDGALLAGGSVTLNKFFHSTNFTLFNSQLDMIAKLIHP